MTAATYALVLVEARRALAARDLPRAAWLYAVIAVAQIEPVGGVQ